MDASSARSAEDGYCSQNVHFENSSRDAEVEDQAPAASLVPEVILDLHVAAPLAHDGGNAVLGADRVSRCPKKRAKGRYYPVVRLVSPEWPVHVACGRRESPSVFFAAALSKGLL